MIRDIDTTVGAAGRDGKRPTITPTRKQIAAAAQEAYDRLWYARHLGLGRPAAGEKSALLLETKYGKSALAICDAWERKLEGRLAALRWVLYGTPENFDT